jgi:2-oxoglutarate ferredoxin oxidoreductase subunit alpha
VCADDVEYLIVAYGLAARIAHRAVELARANGIRAGLLRPITLYPFPYEAVRVLADRARGILVVEMNAGQMVEDVRLGAGGRTQVQFYGRMGGIVPSPDEVVGGLNRIVKRDVERHVEAY